MNEEMRLRNEEREYFNAVREAIEPLIENEDMAACSGRANKVAMLIREINNLIL